MHGPLSLLDDKANLIMLAPKSEFTSEFIQMAQRAANLKVNITAFSNIPEVLALAALNIGLAKGLNVDTPRNLNKVTITL